MITSNFIGADITVAEISLHPHHGGFANQLLPHHQTLVAEKKIGYPMAQDSISSFRRHEVVLDHVTRPFWTMEFKIFVSL
jgi:hypothetical protein